MKVSVIVPFYKVSEFIGRCAESLLSQTLDDIEILFIDDASPDNSRNILENVISRYPGRNVQIITHEFNKGLPAARNTGLAVASGEFIYHCDSDDWVEKDMLEKMYSAAINCNADYVYSDFFLSFADKERYMRNPDFIKPAEMLKDGFLAGTMKYNVWNKLVKRSLYLHNGICFPAGHGMGEDMTMICLAAKANKVAHIPKGLYHYVKLNMNAFSNTFSNKHLEDIDFNMNRTLSFLEDESFSEKEKYISFFKLNVKLPFLFSGDKKQYSLWKKWYPEANSYIFKNKNISVRTRLVQWLASKNQFWLVTIYTWLINKVYYGIIYK